MVEQIAPVSKKIMGSTDLKEADNSRVSFSSTSQLAASLSANDEHRFSLAITHQGHSAISDRENEERDESADNEFDELLSGKARSDISEPEDFSEIEIPWYDITERLPGNSFYDAFKAYRKGFKQAFVIKILKSEIARNPRAAKKFESENKKATKFSHSNLAPTYEYGVTKEGLPYFVTDYIDGVSLATLIREQGCLADEEAIDIFIQICDALNEVHTGDMLHRNLKPRNVIITGDEDGQRIVKVTDAGIAKVLPALHNVDADSSMRKFIGDTRYMSPEQCLGEKLDVRADVYSLGCLMYHTLGGKPPHKHTSSLFTASLHEKHALPLSERFPELGVSLALENVVMRTIQKDKEKRYADVTELQNDLIAIKEAAQAEALKRQHAEPAIVLAQINSKRYSRLFLLAVFLIAVTLTYSAQFIHNQSYNNSTPTALAPPAVRALDAQQSQTPKDSESATLSSDNKLHSPAQELFNIFDTHGKLLISASGASVGNVLQDAVNSGLDMSGASLKGESLTNMNLENAKLRGADFTNSDLSGTNFSHADLQDAQFSSSTVTNAIFDYAQLQNSIITDSELCGSRFFNTFFNNSRWRDCNLDDANLSSADFTGARLVQVESPRASFIGTRAFAEQDRYPAKGTQSCFIASKDGRTLYKSQTGETLKQTIEEAIRNKVSLRGADLRAVDLYEANLTNADLRDADLRGALLSRTTFRDADLRGAQARGAYQEGSPADLAEENVKGWEVLMPEQYPPITEVKTAKILPPNAH